MPTIRAKADALERRGPERINLAAETVSLLVSALRHLATQGMVDRKGTYLVEVWDQPGNHVIEHIGTLSNHAAARAAFVAACEARPSHEVTLRQGARVVDRREAPRGSPATSEPAPIGHSSSGAEAEPRTT